MEGKGREERREKTPNEIVFIFFYFSIFSFLFFCGIVSFLQRNGK